MTVHQHTTHDLDEVFTSFLEALFGPESTEPVSPEEVRMSCGPGDCTGNGVHLHKCDCGEVWKHADNLPFRATEEQNTTAHTCPKCDKQQWFKHYGEV